MEKWTFNRGLREDFLDALNELYGKPGSWWKPLVEDRETFIGVRENSLNVYYRGASLLRLKPLGTGDVAGEVHYKYLVKPRPQDHGDEYVSIGDDGRIDRRQLIPMMSDRVQVDALKAAARNFADAEKTGVHRIAMQEQNAVVDLEVAISDGRVARRIDIAALADHGDKVAVRFFEAKAFANKELRARKPGTPAVVDQIRRYEGLIETHADEIKRSYRCVCENLCRLEGVDLGGGRGELIKQVVDGMPMEIDTRPGLVVFGFDMDQRDGKVWGGHRERLEEEDMLKGRLIDRGKPEDVRLD